MRPCLWPGCPQLVQRGYCAGHQRARNAEHNAAPWRWVYEDQRWRGPRGTRRRCLIRSGYRCEVIENGERCTVGGANGRGLHAHHIRKIRDLVAAGLSPFDERWVRIACTPHHRRLEVELDSSESDSRDSTRSS